MPFIGQDWRSTGEQWVKTSEGWENMRQWRLKLLENINENVLHRLLRQMAYDMNVLDDYRLYSASHPRTGCHPYAYIVRGSRESKAVLSMGETFSKLDFNGALKDPRRFNYVCKTLELIMTTRFSYLSGTAQKLVLNLLETALEQVIKTSNNTAIMSRLLKEARNTLKEGIYYHVGSSSLWARHEELLDKMQNTLNNFEIKKRSDDGKLTISDLPVDCVRKILCRLVDHKDVVNTGLTETRHNELCEEILLWRDLCLFHFNDQQLVTVLRKGESFEDVGWKTLYSRLVKRYGKREIFGEMLYMCKHCNALYWQFHGHPCIFQNEVPRSTPVSPVMLLEFV